MSFTDLDSLVLFFFTSFLMFGAEAGLAPGADLFISVPFWPLDAIRRASQASTWSRMCETASLSGQVSIRHAAEDHRGWMDRHQCDKTTRCHAMLHDSTRRPVSPRNDSSPCRAATLAAYV
ncbi:hypothetical protein EDB81DRAFT_449454 [Dactylonectria macrodidyma]|uniref:Secreted protein n=1 Tax=Dactylonectria macrodidyma TaxID=307937 RepID=A0A9P9F6E3_9HYPO|nr:hypothetical protein EDB81DRAFT_449454 [Dactylonectria macrodidyma]